MRERTKIWLIIAASLTVLGLILFAAGMTGNHWDFTRLSTAKYETNTYQVREEFNRISMTTETADIVYIPSEDGKCKVVCYEPENAKHSVVVQEGTLTIHELNEREWYEYIGVTIGTPRISVYLPDAEYDMLVIKESTGDIEIPKDFRFTSMDISTSTGDVRNDASASGPMKIEAGTGDIRVENVAADTLDLSVSTGGITVSNVTCKGDVKINVSTGKTNMTHIECENVISNGNTGDICLENVNAAEKFLIERSTGDVKFDACDAAEILVKTDTGDVTGSLLSDKVFIIHTDTGSMDVPKTITGGRCEITTETGDIRIKIQQ